MRALLVALVGPALLLAHTWAFSASVNFADLDSWRRLWSDLAVATATFIDSAYGPAPERVSRVARPRRPKCATCSCGASSVRTDGRPARWRPLNPRPFILDRIAPEPKALRRQGKGGAPRAGLPPARRDRTVPDPLARCPRRRRRRRLDGPRARRRRPSAARAWSSPCSSVSRRTSWRRWPSPVTRSASTWSRSCSSSRSPSTRGCTRARPWAAWPRARPRRRWA